MSRQRKALLLVVAVGLLGLLAIDAEAQDRPGVTPKGSSLKTAPGKSGSDHGSVGLFQQQVGGAVKKPKQPATKTLCAPVGGRAPARC